MLRRSVAFLLALVLLAGCSSRPMRAMSRAIGTSAEKDLAAGIRAYEAGEYEDAERLLQRAVEENLTFKSDQVNAHKYLAFVHCVSNEERKCREDFRKVLELDPRFELDKSESGHPIWGPVFRSVRSKK
jgi:Tfp pilus assembly protein PilF